ncbi:MAG: cell division protein FtsA [Verrucomicrobiales bacterium]|nr:cell division protein FtsA [Verrucomicrobiales bacterium]|tara:strand:+ start:35172 stop:36389 length:1218 start_codon:yes stop_codon:yes gene_type:complete
MFDGSQIIVGLEIGTAKVCAVVGEAGSDGATNIIGVGAVPSRGVRKGEIVDTNKAEEDIRAALAEAEQMADVEIESVMLGVSGSHIRAFNNRGVQNITAEDGEIDEGDVEDVLRQASSINLPADCEKIHTVRQHFHVDHQDGVVNPVGMLGSRLEVDVHVVYGQRNRLQNPIRSVGGLQVDVDAIVFNGRASALAVLTPDQCELGALLIDLGAGTTEYVVYSNGTPRHSGVLALGGDHVTNDLAIGLKLSLNKADQLKKENGRAIPDSAAKGESLNLSSDLGFDDQSIKLAHLQLIMHARLEEIFQIIRRDLNDAGLLSELRGGVYLTGGGSRTTAIADLAADVFGAPAKVARDLADSGMQEILGRPEFHAAIGLVKCGARQAGTRKSRGLFGRIFGKARRLARH